MYPSPGGQPGLFVFGWIGHGDTEGTEGREVRKQRGKEVKEIKD